MTKSDDLPAILRKRLHPLPAAGHKAGPSAAEIVQEQKLEVGEKIYAAVVHFGINPEDPDWQHRLNCALLEAYVPGFEVEQRGAELFWTPERELELYDTVKRLQLRRKAYHPDGSENWLDRSKPRPVAAVCRDLAKTDPFNQLSAKSVPARAETLRVKYEGIKDYYLRRATVNDTVDRAYPDIPIGRFVTHFPMRAEAEQIVKNLHEEAKEQELNEVARQLVIKKSEL